VILCLQQEEDEGGGEG